MKKKTRLNITFKNLEFRKITLQEKRKQESDLDFNNQHDPKWMAKTSIYSTFRMKNTNDSM